MTVPIKFCEYQTRAEFEDCDLAGVVYHVNYFNYFERARSAALREVTGKAFSDWVSEGVCLAIARVQADFRRPVRYYDPVYVYTRWKPPTSRSVEVIQYITTEKLDRNSCLESEKDRRIYTRAEFLLVCIGLESKKSIRFPEGYFPGD